jgi:formin 2/WAS/WASL-interacting protein
LRRERGDWLTIAMGFLDKAKKMAEQAQAKLDEAQEQFNSSQQSGQPSGPVVEYDKHGRPIPQAPAAPPQGDPLAESSAPPAPATPTPGVPPTDQGDPVMPTPQAPPVAQPGVPPAAAAPAPPPAGDGPAPQAPPAVPQADAADEDRNHPSFAPPKLTSGDPLAG